MAGFHQLLGEGHIGILALGLDIGAAGAAHIGTFIVDEAGSLQRIVDHVDGAGNFTFLVGIFDAQDELTAAAAGVKIGIERGAQVAQMHITGGAGRKAGAYLHGQKLL